MRKAESALEAARLLVKAQNADSACNRAYYAMFDAAHAALFALGARALPGRSRPTTALSPSSARKSS
jgi:hypothetical protein